MDLQTAMSTADETNPFTKAIDILQAKGWCQETLRARDGRVCLEGALGEAMGAWDYEGQPAHPFWEAIDVIKGIIIEQYGERWDGLAPWNWNDHPGRKPEEVLAVLEKAAIRWDEQTVTS